VSIANQRLIARIVLAAFLLLCALLAWLNFQHQIRLRFAVGQIQTIEQLQERALSSNQPEEYLQAILNFYPSGTKQIRATKLDWIVENARSNALRLVIADLRIKTGKDFGNDARKWIQELDQYRSGRDLRHPVQ
jgi:hypothetical protein